MVLGTDSIALQNVFAIRTRRKVQKVSGVVSNTFFPPPNSGFSPQSKNFLTSSPWLLCLCSLFWGRLRRALGQHHAGADGVLLDLPKGQVPVLWLDRAGHGLLANGDDQYARQLPQPADPGMFRGCRSHGGEPDNHHCL